MSRQRLRTGVLEASTHVCPVCDGAGMVRSRDRACGFADIRQEIESDDAKPIEIDGAAGTDDVAPPAVAILAVGDAAPRGNAAGDHDRRVFKIAIGAHAKFRERQMLAAVEGEIRRQEDADIAERAGLRLARRGLVSGFELDVQSSHGRSLASFHVNSLRKFA